MKKTIILLTAIIATIITTANSVSAQDFNFAKDEEGDLYVAGTISYDCSASTAINRLTAFMQGIFHEDQLTLDEVTGELRIEKAYANSKYIYNPFAGEFKDFVNFDLVIVPDAEAKELHYTFSNLSLHSTAKGFANYDRCEPLRVVLKKYVKSKERVEDPSLDKRGRKDATNEMEDLASSLSKAYEILQVLMNQAQESIE